MIDEFAGPRPQLVVHDAAAAIEFYVQAFGADELTRHHASDGRVMYCELLVGDGRLVVVDDFAGDAASSPRHLGGTTSRMHLYVADVDDTFAQFCRAGGDGIHPPAETFWGERYGEARDPFGHLWSFSRANDGLAPEQVRRQAAQWSGRERGDDSGKP